MKFDSNLAWKHASSSIGANREVLLALSGVFFLLPGLVPGLFLTPPKPTPGQTEAQMAATIWAYYESTLPYLVPAALIQAMGTLTVLTLFTDKSRPTVGVAIKQGLAGVLTYVAAQLLLGMGIGLFGMVALSLGAATGIAAIAGLMLIAVIVVAFYAWIKTSLVAPVVAVESQRNPIKALRRSWRLTKGNSARIGVFYVLLLLAFLVVAAVITLIVGVLLAMAGGQTEKIGNAVVSATLTAALTLYFVGAVAAVHRQLAGPSPEAMSAPFE